MATNTYVALDKVTVGTATPSVTFSSISGSYTDLFVQMNIQGVAGSGSGANTVFVTFNGDTTSGLYSRTILLADSGGAQSSRTTGQNRINLGNAFESASASNTFGTHLLNIQNYSNSTTFKTVLNRYSSNADRVGAVVGLWRNTNAITSLTITVDSSTGNIAAGSTFSLYGIQAWAPEVTPKATGGYVYQDSSYYYHAFPFSGTFTPNQTLSCDYLVIAGGGGGGDNIGGGGGAGGYRSTTAQSLTATGYTVTIGAGGFGSSGSASSFNGLATTGGGKGGGAAQAGSSGGSGGGTGGASNSAGGAGNAGSYSPAEGFAGGAGSNSPNRSGGGGGATAVGSAPPVGGNGDGGAGTSALSSWLAVAGIGQNVSGTYYVAGGGGGGNQDTRTAGAGGIGGGGTGGYRANGIPGMVSTGAGGGGGGNDLTNGFSGAPGGSGLVIVRYAK
jgi:hypothetical protein